MLRYFVALRPASGLLAACWLSYALSPLARWACIPQPCPWLWLAALWLAGCWPACPQPAGLPYRWQIFITYLTKGQGGGVRGGCLDAGGRRGGVGVDPVPAYECI